MRSQEQQILNVMRGSFGQPPVSAANNSGGRQVLSDQQIAGSRRPLSQQLGRTPQATLPAEWRQRVDAAERDLMETRDRNRLGQNQHQTQLNSQVLQTQSTLQQQTVAARQKQTDEGKALREALEARDRAKASTQDEELDALEAEILALESMVPQQRGTPAPSRRPAAAPTVVVPTTAEDRAAAMVAMLIRGPNRGDYAAALRTHAPRLPRAHQETLTEALQRLLPGETEDALELIKNTLEMHDAT